MKKLAFLLFVISFLFIACSSKSGDKFVGTWKVNFETQQTLNSLHITKEGDNFMVKWGDNGSPQIAFYDKDKDLLNVAGTFILYYAKTGNISYQGTEMKKVSN